MKMIKPGKLLTGITESVEISTICLPVTTMILATQQFSCVIYLVIHTHHDGLNELIVANVICFTFLAHI